MVDVGLDPDLSHAQVDYAHELDEVALPPEEPSLPPGEWIRKNLFASVTDTVLTFVFGSLAFIAFRGLLGFTFHPERRWSATFTNVRLLMTQSYPIENYARIWASLGFIVVMTGLSLAMYRSGGVVSMKRISMWLMNLGTIVTSAVLLTPHAPEVIGEDGAPLPTRGYFDVLGDRALWLIIGLLVLGAGLGIWYGMGERRRSVFVPFLGVVFGVLGSLALSLWVVPYGKWEFVSETGEFIAESGVTVAETTKTPWTVMWVLLVGAFALGVLVRDRVEKWMKPLLALLWVLAPFIVYWVIQRAPVIDWDQIFSWDLPLFLGFAVVGGVILMGLSSPGLGEIGRVISVALVGWGLFQWVIAFFGWIEPGWSQKVRISFLLLGLVALVAPTFAGNVATRLRFVAGWVGIIFVTHFVITIVNTDSKLLIQQPTFQGGFNLTLFVASISLLLSFPLGVLLALGRTSSMPIFRLISTGYIELVRGVPLITVLFFFSNVLPLFLPNGMDVAELAAVTLGFVLFSAAYLAENVRGGLQAVRRGQYEAADAVGLSTAQRTSFIVLPQALRVSIPPLVGQAIATYKETSLLFIIGAFDLLRISNNVISQQTEFLGVRKENLLFACVLYWIGSFSMAKYSHKLERRMGLGTR
ncbi:MAG: amino acid ABC transporter permease [Acidimicrobiales bacterium]